MDKLKTILAILAIAVLVASATIVIAQYVMTSNTVNVIVSSQATLTLASNTTSTIVGYGVQLTATCSDGSFVGTVTFLDGASPVGTTAASGGVAVLDYTVSTAKTYAFTATATHP